MWFAAGILELTIKVVPSVLPNQTRAFIEGEATQRIRERVVENLPYSPFAKPRANIVVPVPGYYGPPSDFVYEWTTDRRGFKNLPEIAQRNEFPIVAIGDSYTEGLGVRTEDTWCSRLCEVGLITYSLGVQGYAPAQMAGAFERFGLQLKPRWVIIGYLTNVYQRESHFLKVVDHTEAGSLPSAIGRLMEQDLPEDERRRLGWLPAVSEVRRQFRWGATAIAWHARDLWRKRDAEVLRRLKRGLPDPDNDSRFMPDSKLVADGKISVGNMQRYRAEIEGLEKYLLPPDELAKVPEWQHTLESFRSVIRLAHAAGARVLICVFRNRGTVYYERATGRELPTNFMEDVQARVLEKFASTERVGFVDTKSAFLDAARALDDGTPISSYPYLKYDGHPSVQGHRIIARTIAAYLQSQGFAAEGVPHSAKK